MKRAPMRIERHSIHGDLHIWEITHESLGYFRNRLAPHGGRPVVHPQRAVFGEERGHTLRLLTAPRLRVILCELRQFREIHGKIVKLPTVESCVHAPPTMGWTRREVLSNPHWKAIAQ